MSLLNVNKIDPATGTALEIGTSGDTITVPTGAGLTVTDEVKTNKISPASGTAFTLGDSGDTFTVPSGVTLANSGTATGFGDTMTPAFSVVKTDDQSISNNTDTTVTFQTEILDTDNAFASDKFTIPAGTPDAKYFIFAQCYCNSGNNSDLKVASLNLFVNGSRQALSVFDARANQPRGVGMTISKILGLGAGDYVEVKAKVDTDDAGITIDGGDSQTTFGGFKITT